MSGVKWWHIAIIVTAALALVGSILYTSSTQDRVEFADSIVLADLQTGELVRAKLPKDRAVSLPATNPATSARSLFPVEQTDGTWRVTGRYLPFVKEFVAKPDALANPQTGEVRVANETPNSKDVF